MSSPFTTDRIWTFERYARLGALSLILAGAALLILQGRSVQQSVDEAAAEVVATWRGTSPQRARLGFLLDACDLHGVTDDFGNAILTKEGCYRWAVKEAKRRWSLSAEAELRELQAAQDQAVTTALLLAPAPIAWFVKPDAAQ